MSSEFRFGRVFRVIAPRLIKRIHRSAITRKDVFQRDIPRYLDALLNESISAFPVSRSFELLYEKFAISGRYMDVFEVCTINDFS